MNAGMRVILFHIFS